MTEVNLFGNAKQHSCACAIDPKRSSDIEALLNIPTPRQYVFSPCPNGDVIFRIFSEFRVYAGSDISVQMEMAGIPHEFIKDY
jgi:hypothetical protein